MGHKRKVFFLVVGNFSVMRGDINQSGNKNCEELNHEPFLSQKFQSWVHSFLVMIFSPVSQTQRPQSRTGNYSDSETKSRPF